MTVGFSNETAMCKFVRPNFYECSETSENAVFLSDMLAAVAVKGTIREYALFRKNNWRVSLGLNRVSVGSYLDQDCKAQTEWVRRGMPRKQIPLKETMILRLNISGLKDGCNQSHAMPTSTLRKLTGLKVSKPMFFAKPTRQNSSNRAYNLQIWLIGNKMAFGALSQESNGYCSHRGIYSLCVRRKSRQHNEIAKYVRQISKNSSYIFKKFNFSVEGELSDTDALDLATQANAEIWRRDLIVDALLDIDVQKRLANLIEGGRVVSGLVRVAGKGIPGKAVALTGETATITILGIVGVAILIGLGLMPIPMILLYRKGFVTDVESTYKRAVMKNRWCRLLYGGSKHSSKHLCGQNR